MYNPRNSYKWNNVYSYSQASGALLGKRKYINSRIDQMLDKLEADYGFDAIAHIRQRWNPEMFEQQDQEYMDYETSPMDIDPNYYSSGALLPYRSKVNDVLNMIEEFIGYQADPNESSYSGPAYNNPNYTNQTVNTNIVRNPVSRPQVQQQLTQQLNNPAPAPAPAVPTNNNESFSLF